MPAPPDAAALVQLVHRYYPAHLFTDDARYDASEEAQRLEVLLQSALKDSRPWREFVQTLHQTFPGCLIWDRTRLPLAPCYVCDVALPGIQVGGSRYAAVVCLVSLLAPVYALYATHTLEAGAQSESWHRLPPLPPDFQAHEARLAALLEATFAATRLPNETLLLPVPDLVPRSGNQEPGEARLIDCLFTPHRP